MRKSIFIGVVASSLIAIPSAAQSAAVTGVTTLYTGADYTGTAKTVEHTVCDGTVKIVAGRYQSVFNRPVPGCRVQLYANASPVWVTLCVGQSQVPWQVRLNPEVRAVPGGAPLCA